MNASCLQMMPAAPTPTVPTITIKSTVVGAVLPSVWVCEDLKRTLLVVGKVAIESGRFGVDNASILFTGKKSSTDAWSRLFRTVYTRETSSKSGSTFLQTTSISKYSYLSSF